MFCPWCGSDVPDKAVFCKSCGRNLSGAAHHAVDSSQSNPSWTEPHYQQVPPPTPLQGPPQSSSQASKKPHYSRRSFIVAGAVAATAIAAGGITAWTLLSNKSTEPNSSANSTGEFSQAPQPSDDGDDSQAAVSDEAIVRMENGSYYSKADVANIAYEETGGISYLDNELIVMLDNSAAESVLEDALKGLDAAIVGHLAESSCYQVRFENAKTKEDLESAYESLSELDGVSDVFASYVVGFVPNGKTDPAWSDIEQHWGLKAIDIEAAWGIQRKATVPVGVIDNQFDEAHPDLIGSGGTSVITECKGAGFDKNEKRSPSHGTFVVGEIAACENSLGSVGIADCGEVYAYSMFNNTSFSDSEKLQIGPVTLLIEYLAIFEYLICVKKCKVINQSGGLGFYNPVEELISQAASLTSPFKYLSNGDYTRALAELLGKYIDGGYDFTICQAAGNDGPNKQAAKNDALCAIDEPNVKDRIIVVGALSVKDDPNDEKKDDPSADLQRIYNSTDYCVATYSSVGNRVDILAPGTHIYGPVSDGPVDYDYMSGTSMATPIVAGVAALVYSACPDISPEKVKEVLVSTASGSYADATGHECGLVNALRAVEWAKDIAATNPTVAASIPSDAVSYEGHHYMAYEETLSWTEAKEKCQSLGGHLATISDSGEQGLVSSLVEAGSQNFYWIGLTTEVTQRAERFGWIDSTVFSYSNWAAGEPNNMQWTTDGENYVGMWRDGTWNDFIDDGSRTDGSCGFVCEWDQ